MFFCSFPLAKQAPGFPGACIVLEACCAALDSVCSSAFRAELRESDPLLAVSAVSLRVDESVRRQSSRFSSVSVSCRRMNLLSLSVVLNVAGRSFRHFVIVRLLRMA